MLKLNNVGILSGMGPLCGANFLTDYILELNSRGIAQDSDFPEMTLYSVPFPNSHWTEKGFVYRTKEENLPLIESLHKCMKKFEAHSVQLIAVPCNTIHFLYDEMKNSTDIPVLSIIDEVKKHISEKNYKRVGIFCSDATTELNLYKDINPILATPKEQEVVTEMIYKVMMGIHTIEDKKRFVQLIENKFKNDNLDSLIMGCTEIPVLVSQEDTFVPLIDSTNVLAQALANHTVG